MNFITAMLVRNIREEEDCFWCLVYIMFEHNWREIFDEKSSKIAVLLNDLSNYIKKRHPKVFRHMELDEHVTFEASFSSQIITLFIYDAPFEVATRIFELFLLDGDRAIVDFIGSMIDKQWEKLLMLEELDLMNYLRKEFVLDSIDEYHIKDLIQGEQLVKLQYFENRNKLLLLRRVFTC